MSRNGWQSGVEMRLSDEAVRGIGTTDISLQPAEAVSLSHSEHLVFRLRTRRRRHREIEEAANEAQHHVDDETRK